MRKTEAQVRAPKPRGGTFSFAIRNEKSGAGIDRAEPLERRFAAEFGSIIQEILRDAGLNEPPAWLRVEPWEIWTDPPNIVGDLARADANHGVWANENPKVQDIVLRALNHDLLLGAGLDAVISTDGYFARVMAKKRGVRGDDGSVVFRVIVPDFGDLEWPAILDLREHPGVEDFRSKIREIEQHELDGATSELDARERIHRRVEYDLAQKWRPPSRVDVVGKVAVDLALALLPVPIPAGAAVSAAGAIIEADKMSRTWAAFFVSLRDQLPRR